MDTLTARLPTGDVEVPCRQSLLWWQRKGLSFTRTGYGSRIPTSHMVQLPGSSRWSRVYCMVYSNSGTCYVISKGERIIIGD